MSLMIIDSARFGVSNGFYEFPVINPGAETGDTTGWTPSDAANFASINTIEVGFPGPKTGSRYFTFGTAVAGSTAYQDLTIPSEHEAQVDTGLVSFNLTVWRNSYDGELHRQIIIAYDGSNVELDRFEPIPATTSNYVWVQRVQFLRLPSGTRKVRVIMEGTTRGGSYLDAFFDGVRCWLENYTGTITSYNNTGGKGDRSGVITVTSSGISFGAGTPANLVNGTYANDFWWNNTTNNGTGWIKFDFGSGVTKIINQIRWYQDIRAGSGVWAFEGSNDDSTWTTLHAGFTIDIRMVDIVNTTAYRYYRLVPISGSRSSAAWLREIEFKIN